MLCFCHVHHTNVLCLTLNAFVTSITHTNTSRHTFDDQSLDQYTMLCFCHFHHTHKHFTSMSQVYLWRSIPWSMYYVMLLSRPSHTQTLQIHIAGIPLTINFLINVLCYALSNAFVMSITPMYYVSHYQMLLSCPSHQCTMFHIIKCFCHVHHTHKHFTSISQVYLWWLISWSMYYVMLLSRPSHTQTLHIHIAGIPLTNNPLINVLCYAFVTSITPMYYVSH